MCGKRLVEKIMKFRIRYRRGMSWVGDLKYIVGIVVSLKILNIPIVWAFPLTLILIAVLYILGYIDEKKGVWKIEAKYVTQNINPYFEDIKARIENIERAVGS